MMIGGRAALSRPFWRRGENRDFYHPSQRLYRQRRPGLLRGHPHPAGRGNLGPAHRRRPEGPGHGPRGAVRHSDYPRTQRPHRRTSGPDKEAPGPHLRHRPHLPPAVL